MTGFWVLPTPKPSHKRRTDGIDKRRIYDHTAMIADRLTGMKWKDVAAKHSVGGDGDDGYKARRCVAIVKHSLAFRNLDSETADKVIKNRSTE